MFNIKGREGADPDLTRFLLLGEIPLVCLISIFGENGSCNS